jgi:hypothetical protein
VHADLYEASAQSHRAATQQRRPFDEDALFKPAPLCADADGFSLHAGVATRAGDRAALRKIIRYCARAPLAHRRVSLTDDGWVRYELRKRTQSGQRYLTLQPKAFLRRLIALIPPPWIHLQRAHGVLASASKHHKAAIALTPAAIAAPLAQGLLPAQPAGSHTDASAEQPPSTPAPLPVRIAWSELLAKTFAIDALCCPQCNGRMRLIALIKDKPVIDKILRHLGLPTDLPQLSPARAPPQTDFFFDDVTDDFDA